MNRKFLPLLGIAFLVAVIATAVFYGLIVGRLRDSARGPQRLVVVAARNLEPGAVLTRADLKVSSWGGAETPKDAISAPDEIEGWTVVQPIAENEPLIRTRLASSEAGGGAALAIPSGMRAVSIQAPDSPGVLRLLRPGHRVDVQAIRARGGPRSGEAEIRTLLQDVPVLAVADPKEARQGPGGAVLTVLANPSDAEALSLADATTRIRVVLRNPVDRESAPLRGRDAAGLFEAPLPAAKRPSPGPARPDALPAAAVAGPRVRFDVRVAGATERAVEELGTGLSGRRRTDPLEVGSFREGWDLEDALRRLQQAGQLAIVASSSLVTADHVPVGLHSGGACGVSVRLSPAIGDGKIRLQIQAAAPRAEIGIEAENNRTLLLRGLAPESCPEGAGSRREWLVLVRPRVASLSAPRARPASVTSP